MPIVGVDFLSLGARLAAASTEAEWRTATGRAYFAAFPAARDLFEALGFRVPRADLAHNYLYARLHNCGNAALIATSDDLHELRRARNEADYDISRTHTKQQAAEMITRARRVLQSLASIVDPVRTQITTAMKEYERNILHQVTWSPPPP